MHLMKTLVVLTAVSLAACTPETYVEPLAPADVTGTIKPADDGGPLSFSGMDAETALPDLRLEAPYVWSGCHGDGRMTFHADSTMTWDIDAQVFDSPYLLDAEGRLYLACSEGCEGMIAYRYNLDTEAWRMWDGDCWYVLTLEP